MVHLGFETVNRSGNFPLGTISILRQQRTGWVGSKNLQFLLTFSIIEAELGWVDGSEKFQKYADVI